MIRVTGVRTILTDIEGTTSSIAFVHTILFPYARRHLPEFVARNWAELAPLREAEGMGAVDEPTLTAALLQWIDEDRKAPLLKKLQGLVWRDGYESGQLMGHVYDDAVNLLQNWRRGGIAVYVYSSGSVAAQQLLFRHSIAGDLTGLFTGYFDTAVGAKTSVDSYAAIGAAISCPPADILFLSDAPAEIVAARQAGMQAVRVVRDGPAEPHEVARFDEIEVSR